jgi:hypothetical protein
MSTPPPPSQWQGHGPGCGCFRCAGNLRDNPGRPVHRDHTTRTVLIVIAVILVAIWATYNVASNEAVKNDPPAACQLMGGHWNIWDGWSCY